MRKIHIPCNMHTMVKNFSFNIEYLIPKWKNSEESYHIFWKYFLNWHLNKYFTKFYKIYHSTLRYPNILLCHIFTFFISVAYTTFTISAFLFLFNKLSSSNSTDQSFQAHMVVEGIDTQISHPILISTPCSCINDFFG